MANRLSRSINTEWKKKNDGGIDGISQQFGVSSACCALVFQRKLRLMDVALKNLAIPTARSQNNLIHHHQTFRPSEYNELHRTG